MIEYLEDYISGEKFTDLADFIFGTEICDIKDRQVKDISNIFHSTKNDIIIYCRSNYNYELINFLNINNIKKNITLINHNSDYNINYQLGGISRIFAQNVNIKCENLFSIPIGLENKYNFPEINKISKMKMKLSENRSFKNWVYVNHDVNTNRSKRLGIYENFQNNSNFSIVMGRNGQNFESYIDNIYNHKFVICPEGNGIDTHRTWECLYMGTIPIEKRNINNSFYEGKLPICFINDWSEIDKQFLEKEYERIKNLNYNL